MPKTKVKKLGRPFTIQWSKVNLLWKHKSDSELAKRLECSYTNVYLKRKALMAKAVMEGKNPEAYVYSKPKWTRTKLKPEKV